MRGFCVLDFKNKKKNCASYPLQQGQRCFQRSLRTSKREAVPADDTDIQIFPYLAAGQHAVGSHLLHLPEVCNLVFQKHPQPLLDLLEALLLLHGDGADAIGPESRTGTPSSEISDCVRLTRSATVSPRASAGLVRLHF